MNGAQAGVQPTLTTAGGIISCRISKSAAQWLSGGGGDRRTEAYSAMHCCVSGVDVWQVIGSRLCISGVVTSEQRSCGFWLVSRSCASVCARTCCPVSTCMRGRGIPKLG